MKNFLFKLLSIKYNVLRAFKQSIDVQNQKRKEKENDTSVPNLSQPIESLSMPNEQTSDSLIEKNHQTDKENFPLNQSAIQVRHHLSNKQHDNSQKSPCCRRKTKTIRQNDFMHNQQSLPWIEQTNSYIDTYSNQFLENLFNEKQESLENLGISSHAIRDDWRSDQEQKPSPLSQTKTITIKNSLNNPTSAIKDFSILSFDTGPDTKELYNEMNIRELVNTVRTEIGALIDADRNHPKEQILSSNSKEKSINHNFPKESRFISYNQNINLSALKKKKKKKSKVKRTKNSNKPKVNKKKSRKNKKSKSGKSRTSKRAKPKTRKNLKKSTKRKQKVKKNRLKPSDSIKSSTEPSNKRIPSDTIKSSTESSTQLIPTEQCNNCCCNFLHYSLRQVMHDAEQMKQFALNTAMIGLDPSKLKDPTNTLCPAICLPMYNCENIRDQRFPLGPTFTTISKNELNKINDHSKENKISSMIIQTINTQRGQVQIKLDPHSFGLAPFFSDQYETFIKGPPSSIFFTSYINTYQK